LDASSSGGFVPVGGLAVDLWLQPVDPLFVYEPGGASDSFRELLALGEVLDVPERRVCERDAGCTQRT
jgi:hypothetical protein